MFKELFQEGGVSMERLQEMGAVRVDTRYSGWPPMYKTSFEFDKEKHAERVAEKILKRQSKKAAEEDFLSFKGSKDDDYDLEKHLEELEGTNKKPSVEKAKKKKIKTKKTNNVLQDLMISDNLAEVHNDKDNSQVKKKKEVIDVNKTEETKKEGYGHSKYKKKSHLNLKVENKSKIKEETTNKLIEDKQAKIQDQKNSSKSMLELKDKEMAKLVDGLDATKEEQFKIMKKVSEIDTKMKEHILGVSGERRCSCWRDLLVPEEELGGAVGE